MEETSGTYSQQQAAGATTPGPSNSLTVQVYEEIAKNVGELAAETAIAFAMSRATSKEHLPKLDPGSGIGSSTRQTAPVKKRRERKEPKKQLSVIATTRDKPTPELAEGKKLSSLAGSGEGKNDPPKPPQLLSGQQISRIMGQDLMQQIQTSAYEESQIKSQVGLETISGPPAVKRKRGRPKKIRELVQQTPTMNPESISRSASGSSDAKQPLFTELHGWPIAAIAVNDSAGNMQPTALIIVHPNDDSSQSVSKRPRGRPKKHPPVEQAIINGVDKAMDTDSGIASSTVARLDAVAQCKPEASPSVSEVTPPADTALVKRKRGRPRKAPTTAPVIKRPGGRPPKKIPTINPIIKRPRGRPPKKITTINPIIKRPRGRRPKEMPTINPIIKRPRGRPPKKTPTAAPVIKRPRGRPKKPRPLVTPQQPLRSLGPQLLLSLQPRLASQQPLLLPQQPVDTQTAHEGLRSIETSVNVSLKDKEEVAVATKIVTVEEPKKRVTDSKLLQQPNKVTTAETADLYVDAVSEESTVVPAKRKRGRPPKPKPLETQIKPKRPVGRPRKSSLLMEQPSATSTHIKRPRGRPPKHPSSTKLQELVTTEATSEATIMVDSSSALSDKQPRSRSRKNPQPKQIRLNETTAATCTHSAVVEISPPAMDPQVLAPPLAGGEGDPDVMAAQIPDVPLPCSPLSLVSDNEEAVEVNSTDAPNVPQPFEILSKVRSVLPPEETTNGLGDELVLQRAEPPTTACTAANGVHTVLSPVFNVGRPRKRPLPQDFVESSFQTSEGPLQTKESLTVPVKRPRGRPPKKRQSSEQTPTMDPSAIPVKRRPGRPRKNPPSLTEAGVTSEAKHEGILMKQTSTTAVNVPIKRSVGRPRKTPSLPAATAGRTSILQPSQPPDVPAERGPLPKVGEIPGHVSTPLIHGEIKVKRSLGRPRKRPLEPEPDKECSSAPDRGLPVKKRRGRPSKKQRVQLNETDETSSVCSPDGGTLTAQVKAVMSAVPNESTVKDSSSKASGATNMNLTPGISDESQGSTSKFQLRLSVSFSDSSDDMDSEGDTRTALEMLANRVESDPKAEESEDESSSSYMSTFD